MTYADLTPLEQVETLTAISVYIDILNGTLRDAARTKSATEAEFLAAGIRRAELAYHKLGGTIPDYQPVIYRQHRPGREAHKQNAATGETSQPPKAFASSPPRTQPAGPDPTLAMPAKPPAAGKATAAVTAHAPAAVTAAHPYQKGNVMPDTTRIMDCCGGHVGDHVTDVCPLVARIVDREGARYVSPLGDRRERAVPCAVCHTDTWALDRLCDRHAIETADRATTHLDRDARKALL